MKAKTVKSPSKLPVRKKVPPKDGKKGKDCIAVPKSETDDEIKTMTMSFNISTLFTVGIFSDVTVNMSNPFSSADKKDYNKLFLQKCKECKKICDFSIAIKDKPAKKNKKELLHHLIEAFESNSICNSITPANLSYFIEMVVDNIARPFPSLLKITNVFDFGDQMLDTAWPHLQLVYKAAYRFFSSSSPFLNGKSSGNPSSQKPSSDKPSGGNPSGQKPSSDKPSGNKNDPKAAAHNSSDFDLSKHRNFLSCLVSNCCSPDNRERQATKDILIKIYNKCSSVQNIIKRFIINQFLTSICSAELLEVYVKIVDSLPQPLSEKEVFIFKNAVLLLHTSPLFMKFCLNLLQVIDHYVKRDKTLLEPTIKYIQKHWPVGIVRKQLIFLSELEGLVISYSNLMDEAIATIIFEQLSDLVVQPNIDIAETSLNLFTGSSFDNLLATFPETAIKIMVPPLYESAKKNWNEFVREDATFAIQLLSELDKPTFQKQVEVMKAERKKKKVYAQIWKTNWAKVFETAKKKDKSITGANLEYIL
ncbi:hypothetical protein TRFO_09387 [Tritrichomonas foetus]|uniref:Phosphoprotein phosphatase n=1 Tax=Tritrichomonas foetus TaxID=1144522 RepID=A0A1J4JIQ1_9EUKA|nr:hypothetical protein TRFO_09387 [Tritrichomonas foetus]|eukprot:OHS97413.1 hypothetical protein TRFO_09387 [Tritrichomonas foetus]